MLPSRPRRGGGRAKKGRLQDEEEGGDIDEEGGSAYVPLFPVSPLRPACFNFLLLARSLFRLRFVKVLCIFVLVVFRKASQCLAYLSAIISWCRCFCASFYFLFNCSTRRQLEGRRQ
jgi:hypothetical protein